MSKDEMTGNEQGEAGSYESRTGEAPASGRDPARAVDDTLRQASEALGDGDRGVAGRDYGLIGTMAYRASYGLSYVVVYPASLLARMVPKENALVHGLIDGAAAARDEAPKLGSSSTFSGLAGDGRAPATLPA